MIASQHTQSLTDFRQKASETLDRLNLTGDAEILTVNGEARAVLLSPAAYDQLAREAQLTRDASAIRKAIAELEAGDSPEAGVFFSELRGRAVAAPGPAARRRRQSEGATASPAREPA